MSRDEGPKSQRKAEWILWFIGGGMLLATVLLLWRMYTISTKQSVHVNCDVPWETISDRNLTSKICITTLTDANVDSIFARRAPRNFSNVLEATWDNKATYARKHGYELFNGSHLVDTSRPPSWSKIIAVKDALDRGCEWVFWMDADALIMNSRFRLEQLIPTNKDAGFIIIIDLNGVNAGIWMVHNDTWARNFLDRWWGMKSYIIGPGGSLSGDNEALRRLIGRLGSEDKKHVFFPPQCAMNSYIYDVSLKSMLKKYKRRTKRVKEGQYHPGQFIVHFAGKDDKMRYINKMKGEAS